jgi:hypothetical protein
MAFVLILLLGFASAIPSNQNSIASGWAPWEGWRGRGELQTPLPDPASCKKAKSMASI